MRLHRCLIGLALAAALCSGQTAVSIKGKVVDPTGAGISDAAVKLEVAGVTATSGADGSFALVGTGVRQYARGSMYFPSGSATLENGILGIDVARHTALSVGVFDGGGRLLWTVKQTVAPGSHGFAVPRLSNGLRVIRVSLNGEHFTFVDAMAGLAGRDVAPRSGAATASGQLAKIEATTFTDTLRFEKPGQLVYRTMIYKADTSGMVIKMLPVADTVSDADGNVYHAVRIGDQIWTVENLRTTKYTDGTSIPYVTDSAAWVTGRAGYCFYKHTTDSVEKVKWGALYNWNCWVVWPGGMDHWVDSRRIVRAPWRVGTHEDWKTLETWLTLNGYAYDGSTALPTTAPNVADNKIGKALASRTDWKRSSGVGFVGSNLPLNNRSGFEGLPAGYRDETGKFLNRGTQTYFWTSTEGHPGNAWARSLGHDTWPADAMLDRSPPNWPTGCSVRLVRDAP